MLRQNFGLRCFATKGQLAGYKKHHPPPSPVAFDDPAYRAAPPEALANRPHLLHRTAFESQYVVNRRLYKEQVHELRKLYFEEHKKIADADKLKRQKAEEQEKQQIHLRLLARRAKKRENIAKHEARMAQFRKAKEANRDKSARIRLAREGNQRTKELHQVYYLSNERKHWIMSPEAVTMDPFLFGNEHTEPGFWPKRGDNDIEIEDVLLGAEQVEETVTDSSDMFSEDTERSTQADSSYDEEPRSDE